MRVCLLSGATCPVCPTWGEFPFLFFIFWKAPQFSNYCARIWNRLFLWSAPRWIYHSEIIVLWIRQHAGSLMLLLCHEAALPVLTYQMEAVIFLCFWLLSWFPQQFPICYNIAKRNVQSSSCFQLKTFTNGSAHKLDCHTAAVSICKCHINSRYRNRIEHPTFLISQLSIGALWLNSVISRKYLAGEIHD